MSLDCKRAPLASLGPYKEALRSQQSFFGLLSDLFGSLWISLPLSEEPKISAENKQEPGEVSLDCSTSSGFLGPLERSPKKPGKLLWVSLDLFSSLRGAKEIKSGPVCYGTEQEPGTSP